MQDLFKTTSTDSVRFLLDGDLNQMIIQRNFLLSHGFEVLQNNVCPSLNKEDLKRALTIIWQQNVEGWWHYQKKYEELGMCTVEEYKNKLSRS